MHSSPFHSRKTVQKCQNPSLSPSSRNYHPRGRSGYFYGNKGRGNDFLDADDDDDDDGGEGAESAENPSTDGLLSCSSAARPIKVRQKNFLANSAENREGIASRCARICDEANIVAESDGRNPSFGIILSLYSRVKVYLSGEGPGFRGGCRTSSAAPVTEPAGRSDAANKSGRMTEIAANVFLGMGMPSERARARGGPDGETIPKKLKG